MLRAFPTSVLLAFVAAWSTPAAPAQVEWTARPLPARSSHAMAFDPVAGRMLTFGGANCVEHTSWSTTLALQAGRWIELAPMTSPPGRVRHAMVTERDRIVLFGGNDSTGTPLGDTWQWDGATWAQLQPANRPSPRRDHAMAYDAARRRIVLFGGWGSAGTLDDTWEWDGTNWSRRTPARSPIVRTGHAMTYSAATGLVFLFGGNSRGTELDDLWTWDGTNWQQWLPTAGPRPAARMDCAMGYDAAADRVIVMGGSSRPAIPLADLWEWDHARLRWQPRSATGPRPRADHQMAFDPRRGRFIVFGGLDQARGCLTDTWEWNGRSWTDLRTDSPPGPRWSVAMAFDRTAGCAVLFGGQAYSNLQDDTWSWDGNTWTEHSPVRRPPPLERHVMAYDPIRDRTVLFGGRVNGLPVDDTWEWDGRAWLLRSPPRSPPARSDAAMVADTHRGRLVLFGGSTPGRTLGDVWEWDGVEWHSTFFRNRPTPRLWHAMAYDAARRVTVLFGGMGGGFPLADTWEWDGSEWTRRLPTPAPLPRASHSMVYDEARQRVVLFGGYGVTRYDDVWEWDGEAWTQRATTVSPPASSQHHAMLYDPARGRTLIYGDPHQLGVWEYGPIDPATFAPFGSGCAGSNGTPVLVAGPFERPWLGDTFAVEIRNAPIGLPAAIALGSSHTRWGNVGLPFDLGRAGMPGCMLFASADLLLPAPSAAGTAHLRLPIPNDAALIGGTFFGQGLLLDPGTNSAGLIVSNAAAATVGAR